MVLLGSPVSRGRPGAAAAAAAALEGRREKMKGSGVSSPPSPPSEVLREGELEKRSEGLFQLWKKKQAVLRKESLSLSSEGAGGGKGGRGGGGGGGGGGGASSSAKELPFDAIQKVDCVERTGKYVYFTLVTTDRREIDFRCPGESCWNASIALALIAFQNQRAVRDFKSRQEAAESGTPTGRAPTGGGGGGQRRT